MSSEYRPLTVEVNPFSGISHIQIALPGGAQLNPNLGYYTRSKDSIEIERMSPHRAGIFSGRLIQEMSAPTHSGIQEIGILSTGIQSSGNLALIATYFTLPQHEIPTVGIHHTFDPDGLGKEDGKMKAKMYIGENEIVFSPDGKGRDYCLVSSKKRKGFEKMDRINNSISFKGRQKDGTEIFSQAMYLNEGIIRFTTGILSKRDNFGVYLWMNVPLYAQTSIGSIEDGPMYFNAAQEHAELGNYTSLSALRQSLRGWSQRAIEIGASSIDFSANY